MRRLILLDFKRDERFRDMRNVRFNSRHEVHSIYESREEGDSPLNDRNLSQLPRDTVDRASESVCCESRAGAFARDDSVNGTTISRTSRSHG